MLGRFVRSTVGGLAQTTTRNARLISRTTLSPSSSSGSGGDGERIAPFSAPPGEASVGDLSPEQVQLIGERFDALRKDHHALKTDFPVHAQAGGAGNPAIDAANAYRKRLVYRSKQRGWLEVDLLLGTFAEHHVWQMNEADLAMYEDIINEETIDIFNFMTEKEEVPPHLCNHVMSRLQEWCASGPLGNTPEEYAAAKQRDGGLT